MPRPEVAAQDLLETLELDHPPTPVEKIAEALGASIVYRGLEGNVSGMLYRDEVAEETVIGVNSRHPKTRQRFTIAHEIAHLRLHRGRPVIIDREVRLNLRDDLASAATDSEEIDANRFAAELLMPRELIFTTAEDLDDLSRAQLVAELADTFEVSKQAMEYRLLNLGIVPS